MSQLKTRFIFFFFFERKQKKLNKKLNKKQRKREKKKQKLDVQRLKMAGHQRSAKGWNKTTSVDGVVIVMSDGCLARDCSTATLIELASSGPAVIYLEPGFTS